MSRKALTCFGAFSVIFVSGMNSIGFSAPTSGTRCGETPSNASSVVPRLLNGTKSDIALNTSSNLTVIYFPYQLNIYRLYGVGPTNMMQALTEFRATGNAHPLGPGSYAITICSPSQKELILGLLDTKSDPVKSKEGESEILLTEPAWNKSIIIDQYGKVADGFRLYQYKQELFQELAQHNLEIEGFREYKLTPIVFSKLLNLMKTLSSP